MMSVTSCAAPRTLGRVVRQSLSLLSLAMLSCVLLPASTHAQLSGVADESAREAGSIKGTLVTKDVNKPAANVTVVIRETGQSTTTDQKGRYEFEQVTPGTYTLIASGENYGRTRITDVVVRPGHELSLSRQTIVSRSPNHEPLQLDEYVVSAKKEGIVELQEYEVTGRKEKPFTTSNMDIPRSINDAQAYYIFDSKTLEQSGASNAEEFLKRRLTMNTVAQTATQTSNASGSINTRGATSTFDLRGLGADKTLVLVNGRQQAGVSLAGFTLSNQPDVNAIPMEAIDRIEVLPSSASAIYGSSALGGVINIILKSNYTGGSVRFTYNNVWDTDAPGRQAALTYGLSLEGGRTNITASASWRDSKPLLLVDRRDILEANVSAILQRAPSYIYNSSSPFLGSLPNIQSTSTLVLKDGRSLNSTITHVGAGISNATSTADLYASLLANAGTWDLNPPMATTNPGGLLKPIGTPLKTNSAQVSIRRQMSPHLEMFAEFAYVANTSDALNDSFQGSYSLSAASVLNPFTTAIRVRTPNNYAFPLHRFSEQRTTTIGFVAHLPQNWVAEADYTHSAAFNTFRYLQQDTAISTYASNGLFNPLVDTLAFPLDLTPFGVKYSNRSRQTLDQLSARANGKVTLVGTYAFDATVGAQHALQRSPEGDYYSFINTYPLSTAGGRYTAYARRQVMDSIFGELNLPLLGKASQRRFLLDDLSVQVAGRLDRFSVDTGTTLQLVQPGNRISYVGPTVNGAPYFSRTTYVANNGTFGIKYSPVRDIFFRASISTAFLPPTPTQLVKDPLPSSTATLVNDTKTGQTSVPVFTIGGGNPDLKPQASRSYNLGVVWQPSVAPFDGLRLNVEFYHVQQFDYIASMGAQQIVDLESIYPERVIRTGGVITQVDVSALNLYSRNSEGVDLSVDYSMKSTAGTFTVGAAGTMIRRLQSQYSLTSPAYDAVGYPSENGAAKYKANGNFNWSRAGWTVGWTTRFFGAYRQSGSVGGPSAAQRATNGTTPAARAPSTTVTLPQGGDTIPSQTYHDLFLSYAFGHSGTTDRGDGFRALRNALFSNITVQAGVTNVFSKVPPFDVYYQNNYYLSPYGDIQKRAYWVSIKKTF